MATTMAADARNRAARKAVRDMRTDMAEHARGCGTCDDRAGVPVFAGGPYRRFVSHHELCPVYRRELRERGYPA